MIVRIWKGEVPSAKATAYRQLMLERAVPDYRATPGNLDAWCLSRALGDRVEFTMLTRWRDMDSIRAFAGSEVERARYYDFDPDFLIAMPETVAHYEVDG